MVLHSQACWTFVSSQSTSCVSLKLPLSYLHLCSLIWVLTLPYFAPLPPPQKCPEIQLRKRGRPPKAPQRPSISHQKVKSINESLEQSTLLTGNHRPQSGRGRTRGQRTTHHSLPKTSATRPSTPELDSEPPPDSRPVKSMRTYVDGVAGSKGT